MMWGEGRLFGGPGNGRTVCFLGTPPPMFRCSEEEAKTVPEPERGAVLVTQGEVDYLKVCTLESGVAIYDYVRPTESAELAFKVTVPKGTSTQVKGRLPEVVADALRGKDCVKSAELIYTGPTR